MDSDALYAIADEVCRATGARVVRPWALVAAAAASAGVIGIERVGSAEAMGATIVALEPLSSANELFAEVAVGVARR
ncbi:MAG: hypothetical protein ACHEUT_00310 [Corynebacterium pyruviciproducens]|uniref:hypothetical protein n=1 Tax=Corynebacterium pyruviciproducens TaxID=598660 RepID=UPI002456CFA5|nr:hypothetical protein [Corynebacterium pyruviciproducens]MDH4658152.1 hypothetical protein [Corynebacterium pyruviciproducens]